MAAHSILYLEPDTLIRRGVTLLMNSYTSFEVIAEASNYDEALNGVEDLDPDILLLEVSIPGTSGLELLYELRRRRARAKPVVLSSIIDDELAQQCFVAGAKGYLTKSIEEDELETALEEIIDGREYLRAPAANHEPCELKHPQLDEIDNGDPLEPLSAREREIFHMLADGLQNAAIARKLFISPRTVETHRARVVRKLNLGSNAELIRYAIKHGLSTV